MPAKKVLSASAPVKKPSLASLKPDKELNKRARTKAVKRIESHVSKKTPAKKSPIVVKKKKEATGLAVKRVVKKKVPAKNDPVLVLPKNMSIRAREKALVLLEQISKDFQKPAERVAYVSGLCFMLLGASMALAFSGTISSESQSALLGNSTNQTSQAQTTTVDQAVPKAAPELSLLDSLPIEARTASEHKFAVLNAKNIQVKARSLETGKIETLAVKDLSLELYKFIIEPGNLSSGKYSVVANAVSTFDGSRHTFDFGEFFIPTASETATTSDMMRTETVANEAEEEEQDSEVTASSTTATGSNAASSTEPTTPAVKDPVLVVTVPDGSFSNRVLIKVDAPRDLPFIELYVRQPKSSNSRFVGLAEKRSDAWYFFFNSIDVPNGDYEILARTRVSGTELTSAGKKITISNFASSAPAIVEQIDSEEVSNEESIHSEPQVSAGRSLPGFTLSDINEEDAEGISTPTPGEVQSVLALYQAEIRQLFDRYAVAQQSGDTTLIELAEKELQEGRARILTTILSDQSINYLADEAEKVLDERFAILKKRVATFEELRRTASNSSTSVDTDKDGISDFDEQNLFGTNHELPDTDNDGIQDGVEIMKGFDPLNPDTEAVIVYELPQESLGLVQDEVLKIETVLPVIKNDPETGKAVQAEIRGKALPNSYVTLYIFSNPTIVTVRSDESGSFSYTFEKELEDGNHEVYVAITDNTGAIVARSNPFRFVKQAEAFTPLNGNEIAVENTSSFNAIGTMSSYNTIVGLGILAFGLILLMLGVSMREKAGLAPQEPSHDLKTS